MNQQQEVTTRISTAGIARKGDKYLVALRKPGTSIGESWEFPGGKQRNSETPQEALKREYREEFSVDIVVGDSLYTDYFQNRNDQYRLEAYEVQLISESFVLREHQAIRWVHLKDLKHMPMASSDRSILRFLERRREEAEAD
ncbi:MAG: (deoxy)nucleoside triphosphate pyrophosphohydrolase [Sediminispirochaetaceae bacterium]|nr:NUDIX domain-containing protein [Spirochaetota bacterium]